jgi:reactive chlorine resistance protein C
MLQDLGRERESSSNSLLLNILYAASKLDRAAMGMLRAALVLVLVWIGGLKFVNYEADSIVPLVANSPLMSFLYRQPAEYRSHMNKEGELNPQHRAWHQENGTYSFSHGLGVVIVSIGILIALYPLKPELSALGSFLLILMSCTTLSFLITTPEAWVPAIGDAEHGFPYLSGAGRLIVKDCIMLAAAVVTLVDSAKSALRRR